MESAPFEGQNPVDQKLQKRFEYYSKDFPLTEEELKQPLLDVGAGDGGFVQYIREVLHNENAVAVESQERKISTDKKEWLIHADGLKLPFDDNTFDTVTAHNYLPMFVSDPEKMQRAITELLRVVKENGRVLGDIATVQREIESEEEIKKNIGDLYGEKDQQHSVQRIEGAKKLAEFLQELSKHSKVTFAGHQKNILIITKTSS